MKIKPASELPDNAAVERVVYGHRNFIRWKGADALYQAPGWVWQLVGQSRKAHKDVTERCPGIKQAALMIACDNGVINRAHTEEDVVKDLCAILANELPSTLGAVDQFLCGQTFDQVLTICTGEHEKSQALLKTAPPNVDRLLNEIFDRL